MVKGHPDDDIRVCYDEECAFCAGMANEWRCTAGKVIFKHEGYNVIVDGMRTPIHRLICYTRVQRKDEK